MWSSPSLTLVISMQITSVKIMIVKKHPNNLNQYTLLVSVDLFGIWIWYVRNTWSVDQNNRNRVHPVWVISAKNKTGF